MPPEILVKRLYIPDCKISLAFFIFYFCCFPLALANICPWPPVLFFQTSLKNGALKTTHNCRVHFFPHAFLEITIQSVFTALFTNLRTLKLKSRLRAGAHLDELQHGGRKPTDASVTEFCYKSMKLFLEKLINIKVILFLIHDLFK